MKGTILLRLTVHSLVKTTELTTVGSFVSTGKSLRSTSPSWPPTPLRKWQTLPRLLKGVKYSPLPTVDFQAYNTVLDGLHLQGAASSSNSLARGRFTSAHLLQSRAEPIANWSPSYSLLSKFRFTQVGQTHFSTSLLCLVADYSPLLIHQSLVSYSMSYPKQTSSVRFAVSDNKWERKDRLPHQ